MGVKNKDNDEEKEGRGEGMCSGVAWKTINNSVSQNTETSESNCPL